MRNVLRTPRWGPAGLALGAVLMVWGCGAAAPTPSPSPPPTPPASTYPALEEGAWEEDDARELGRLQAAMVEAAALERWEEVRTLALQATGRVPTVPGASEVLLHLARASLETGRWEEADSAASLLDQRLPSAHPAGPVARVLLGTARIHSGDPQGGGTILAAVPPSSLPPSLAGRVARWLGEWSGGADEVRLRALREAVPPGSPYLAELPPGREEPATGPGALPASVIRALRLGVILPRSGSPTQQQFATLLDEGIAVALAPHQGPGGLPAVERQDDAGEVSGARVALQRLTEAGVAAVVGPLLDPQMDAVAAARTGPVILVSPTARGLPPGAEGVLTLSGPDPTGPTLLARHAAAVGYGRVVVIHPANLEGETEGRTFSEAFREAGGGEARLLAYRPGITDFQELLAEARRFGARALVAAVPAADVVTLAPQVSFSGLDTLGVHVLGTAPWASEAVLEAVDPRHTDGVVVATPRGVLQAEEAAAAFERGYEALHRRSLRSPVPALGHDAVLLILEAARRGGGTSQGIRNGLTQIQGLAGATGVLSVRNGAVVREHRLARLLQRELHPLEVGELPTEPQLGGTPNNPRR